MKKYKKIYIEITNQCNLSCSFCQVSSRSIRHMSADEFGHVLNQIAPYTNFIYLHVKGEPLLHEQILHFIALAEAKNIKVTITTNGTLINKHHHFIASPNIRQINFSLHSLNELHKSRYQTSLDEIIAFIKKAQTHSNMFIALRFWNVNEKKNNSINENQPIIDQLIRAFTPSADTISKINQSINAKLSDKVFVHFDSVFDWPEMDSDYSKAEGFCYGLRDQVGILSDGTVVPCCIDGEGNINLGNVFKTDFQSIINSERAQNIVKWFSDNKAIEELCIKCSFKQKFSR